MAVKLYRMVFHENPVNTPYEILSEFCFPVYACPNSIANEKFEACRVAKSLLEANSCSIVEIELLWSKEEWYAEVFFENQLLCKVYVIAV